MQSTTCQFLHHFMSALLAALDYTNLRKGTRRHGGGGGMSIGHLPSTFDTILAIDLIFGTCNELSLYFRLIKTKWYLIGFYGNHNNINDVTSAVSGTPIQIMIQTAGRRSRVT